MTILNSKYNAPGFLKSGHVQTIYSSMFRKIDIPNYVRERIETVEEDFLDLDWSKIGSGKLVIISHGLEGNTNRPYVTGMVRELNNSGFDVLAWNFRSCSGEINKVLRFYHSGSSDDLETVIEHVNKDYNYNTISLVGFSMGGNVTLKYLGENIRNKISNAVVISVPCDLKSSSEELSRKRNWIYMKRFLLKLKKKLLAKKELYPNKISLEGFNKIKNFKTYDDIYTAPIHGFKNAEDYWAKCSSINLISDIQIPTLIINALDDPFLSGSCYPFNETEESEAVFLETPKHGGHVGFVDFNNAGSFWSERRAVEFLNNSMRVK
ncbi:MAG: alpha/beta fold hydrolase [Melioribacteraceae bacterium]|nr:alpha/beta fold hydrolase [Melioribacteraceae bacterium]